MRTETVIEGWMLSGDGGGGLGATVLDGGTED